MNRPARLLRSPLLHFLLLGAAVFVVFRLTRDTVTETPRDEIVVTAAQTDQLVEVFRKTWQRAPNPSEREKLIESRIREEVFYREALAAGLDRDDTIVRRRMKQKLEFMMEDIAGQVAPSDGELRAFLQENADRFRSEPVLSFRHVYLSPDRRKEVGRDASEMLRRLRSGEAVEGDSLLMLPSEFTQAPLREVERALGREFAASIATLPVGEWAGPIRSGFGAHLVLVIKRIDGRLPELAEIRDAVASEWQVAKREELREALYKELRAKYTITVEKG